MYFSHCIIYLQKVQCFNRKGVIQVTSDDLIDRITYHLRYLSIGALRRVLKFVERERERLKRL